MSWYFLFFTVSGFCSLVYQVVWLRIAMATFGVTTPSVAIFLSIFMAGLALGSWGGGLFVSRFPANGPVTYLRTYAATEGLIALSGIVVAPLLAAAHHLLATAGGVLWGSSAYYLASATLLAATVLPFCTCMGATVPLAMAAVRSAYPGNAATSFSYLYTANLLGAMAGCLVSAFILIELLGFRGTMLLAALLNLLVAGAALLLGLRRRPSADARQHEVENTGPAVAGKKRLLVLLFTTGAVSLAMEVVWTRLFLPYMGPVVYTFATILAVYLGATLIGSRIYRRWSQIRQFTASVEFWQVLALLAGLAAFLPLPASDWRLPVPIGLMGGTVRLLGGIGPFCALLGFMTPAVLDRLSAGEPRTAGYAYALNTLGCLAGPLFAGFLLLPFLGERWALLLLALPLLLFALIPTDGTAGDSSFTLGKRGRWLKAGGLLALPLLVFGTQDMEKMVPNAIVSHDHTATVIAAGTGMDKQLFVNGNGMTFLTPITKMMVHLPLSFLPEPPRNGLVLCLGMGTSYRSLLSWGVPTTVVELVPSVPRLLPFFQSDGGRLLRAANGRIVIDDARRFLERSRETFDVIVVDPPPPLEAAASSLLYSVEFYEAVARRLAPGGILQQWIPLAWADASGETLVASMVGSLATVFPHVRVFSSFDDVGLHLLASKEPIPATDAGTMAARFPASAAADLVEWGPLSDPRAQLKIILDQEIPLGMVLDRAPAAPLLTDDRPVNEYYLLRQLLHRPQSG